MRRLVPLQATLTRYETTNRYVIGRVWQQKWIYTWLSSLAGRRWQQKRIKYSLAFPLKKRERKKETRTKLSCCHPLQRSNQLQSQQPTRQCCYKILLRGWLAGRFLSASNAMQMLPLPSLTVTDWNSLSHRGWMTPAPSHSLWPPATPEPYLHNQPTSENPSRYSTMLSKSSRKAHTTQH